MADVIGKIAASTFLPKRILGQEETVQTMVLGTLIGQATDFKTGTSTTPTGEKFSFKGYTGRFEYVDAHNGKVIQSGVLYLPDGIDQMLSEAVKAAVEVSGHVNVMLEVSVFRSKVPGGYSWSFNQLGQLEANDPLEELRKAMTAAKTGEGNLLSAENVIAIEDNSGDDAPTAAELSGDTSADPEPAATGKRK